MSYPTHNAIRATLKLDATSIPVDVVMEVEHSVVDNRRNVKGRLWLPSGASTVAKALVDGQVAELVLPNGRTERIVVHGMVISPDGYSPVAFLLAEHLVDLDGEDNRGAD